MEHILLDVHAHLIPIEGLPASNLQGVAWNSTDESLTLDGHTHGQKALYRPRELLDWMSRNAVDRAWISLPPFGYRHTIGVADAREWTEYVNNGLLALANRIPDRLQPLFHLPVDHPALAAEVASHWIARGRPRFAMASGDGAKIVLSDPAYDALWSVLDAAHAFLFLHPSECGDPRLKPFHLHNLIGNPTETAIAASHLVLAEVMDRYPDLCICLAHGGGTTAAVAGRIERGRLTGRPGLDKHKTDLRGKFRRFCVDCIVHDTDAMRMTTEVHGVGHVLFGSDWPFGMGMTEPHVQLAGLDPAFRRAIFADNALRLGLVAQDDQPSAAETAAVR